jgi:hypothetical protein
MADITGNYDQAVWPYQTGKVGDNSRWRNNF